MDQIIEKAGSFGHFQAMIFFIATLSTAVTVWSMIFMAFGNYNPGWSCEDIVNLNGTDSSGTETVTTSANITLWVTHDERMFTNATAPTCELWARCGRRKFDTASSSTIVTEWNLMCDRSWILSIIITVQMSGVLVGAFVCGPIGEMFGRKVSLFSSIGLMAVSNFVCAFSSSWEMFAAVRFFIGVSVGGVLPTAFVYPLEFVDAWWRSVFCAIPSWSFGTVSFALIAFIFRDWKSMHFATAVMSTFCFLPVFWVPDSMRWLAVNDRMDQFKAVVHRISSFNNKPPVDSEFIERHIKQIADTKDQASSWNYLHLFKTKKLTKYSLKFGFIWVVMSLAYFTISFSVRSFSGNFYLNFLIFGSMEMVPSVFVGPLSNRFGRRFCSSLFLMLGSVSAFGVVVFKLVPGVNSGALTIALATTSNMAIVTCWKPVSLMSSELYPTVVRNLQSAYLNSMARFGGIISSYIIPADENDVYITYATMGALLLACVFTVCSVSETKGRAMTDVINERVPTDTEAGQSLMKI